ncbi:hypothetical protein [Parerythrobacter aestuarii]|uniref:hypothetical protein n=1 Tax=Parerythrobacter aestuarii TaxID=3020909 RepID=UPI0024DE5D0B|nr:hypothetical protein [Parerythrobacter aestuarii]
MPKYIFHLGYPKTGTTYLQRRIFSQLAGQQVVITPESENIGMSIQALKSQIQRDEVSEKFFDNLGDRNLLLSIEGMLFDPIQQFHRPEQRRPKFPAALRGIRSIISRNPGTDAALVVTLRAQPSLLHSLYAESATYHFNPIGLDTIEAYAQAVMDSSEGPHQAGWYYNFDNTLAEIRAELPDIPLHVRYYEELGNNPAGEIAFWSELTGRTLEHVQGRDNTRAQGEGIKRADPRSLHVPIINLKTKLAPGLKLPNKMRFFVRDTLKKIGRGESYDITLSDELEGRLFAHFSKLNADLSALGVNPPESIAHLYLDSLVTAS